MTVAVIRPRLNEVVGTTAVAEITAFVEDATEITTFVEDATIITVSVE